MTPLSMFASVIAGHYFSKTVSGNQKYEGYQVQPAEQTVKMELGLGGGESNVWHEHLVWGVRAFYQLSAIR